MGKRFELGQPCIVRPVTFNMGLFGNTQPAKGTIVYIHPRLRYVTVAINLPGGEVRESFFPDDVQPIEQQKKRKR